MTPKKWFILEGKVYKLVEVLNSEQEARSLALALKDNCHTTMHRLKDGKWGVYWKPYTGTLCPYGDV